MQFDLLATPQIYFGTGKVETLGNLISEFGSKALIVGSESALKVINLEKIFTNQNLEYIRFIAKGEPTIELVDRGVAAGLDYKAEVVVGVGGGSALDAGKAIAGIIKNGGSARDYMDVIGKGLKIIHPALPYIAVPTTAGTGTEVTKNAVIKSPEDGYKASIRSPLLVPKVALIDPTLTLSVPSKITASSGLDALCQLIEAYTSNKSNPVTDALALLGIQKAINSLLVAYEDGTNLNAREDMALAALLSGICLANAGLGAVHGFASPLGGSFPIPHGVVCAALLAGVVEQNILSLKPSKTSLQTLVKYAKMGELVIKKPIKYREDDYQIIIDYLKTLTQKLHTPSLSTYGLKETDFPAIIEKVKKSSSYRYNPVKLDDAALSGILRQAL